MANPAAILSILVRANTASANLGLAKVNAQARMTATHFGEIDKSSGKTSRALGAVGKVAAAGALGGFVALAAGAKKAFDEFQESEKATAQTRAVIKSTGHAAKVTAKQIEGLANRISLKSGIDDEAIQSGENLLLTFTKIRNEQGKGNKIFDRATQTITDMSVALDQDLKSSAIQVGKALQDPQKGITALRRVGVNFTQTQSDMITKWVEHGKQLKAQKFILRELTKEFGGSAAAQATGADKLKVAWDNMFESIGKSIGPWLERAMGNLAKFIRQMQNGKGAGGVFVDVLKVIGKVIKEVVVSFVHFGKWLVNAYHNIDEFGKRHGIWTAIRDAVQEVVASFKHLWEWVGNALHNFKRFRDGAQRVAEAVWGWFKDAFNNIKRVFGNVMAFILRRMADLFDLAAKLPFIGGKFKDLADKARGAANRVDQLGENIRDLPAHKKMKLQVSLALNDLALGNVPPLRDLSGGPSGGPPSTGQLMDGIEAGGKKRTREWVMSHLDQIAPLLGAPGTAPGTLGLLETLGHRMGLVTSSGYRPGDPGFHGQNRARDLAGPAGTMLAYARMLYNRFGTTINELIHTPLGVGIDNHIAGPLTSLYPASTLADHYDHVHVAMQRGGMIPGQGSGDKVPVLAEPGEGFINSRAVRALGGPRAIAAINRAVPRFQSGGTVSREYRRLIGMASKRYGIPGYILAGLIDVESSWDPNAVSGAGAFGLTQFMPGTAAGYGVRRGSSHGAVASQILGAAHYLKDLGYARNRMFALGAYNGGPGNPQYGYAHDVLAASGKYRGILAAIKRRAHRGGGGSGSHKVAATHGALTNRGIIEERQDRRFAMRQDMLSHIRDDDVVTATEAAHAFKTYGRRAQVLQGRIARMKRRLRKINRALHGKLRPATRQRLLEEKQTLLSDIGTIRADVRGLTGEYKDLVAPGDDGTSADTSAADLAVAMKELKASIDEQNRIATSVAGIGQKTALKAFADVISGQMGGLAGQRARSAGDGVTGARY